MVVALAALAIALGPSADVWGWVVRGSAIVGYVFAFLAILSSAYMRQLLRILGRPFLWAHHVVAAGSLILVTLHPLGVAIDAASAAVFIPRFDSWRVFLELAGRPALYLMYVGSLAALLRRSWRKSWRIIHVLNYVAFALGTVHAVLIGSDLGRPALRPIPIIMALIVLAVFVQKRIAQQRVRARRRG
jgi:hypothetical protein